MLYFDFGSHILIYRNIIFELLLVSSLLLVKDKICFVCFKMSRYRKRFSKKGFEKLENNNTSSTYSNMLSVYLAPGGGEGGEG